jgi:putative ABC transport system permease protein
MLFNYLKVAIRNLLKKKVFTIINMVGLSVGTTASLLIFLYVQGELSYDKFFPDTDRIYRVVEDRIYPDRLAHFAMIPAGFSTILPDEVPEVEMSTRLVGFPNFAQVMKYNDNTFSERYIFGADSNFFEMFPYRLLKGDPKRVLRNTNTIILTEGTAARYFGKDDPMGKHLEIAGQKVEVVGVMENVPESSHMKFDALTPTLGIGFLQDPSFYIAGTFTYVKLAKDADATLAETKFPALVEKYAAGQIERDLGVSFKKYIADGNGYKYFLQPLADIHLHSQRTNEIKPGGSITAVRALGFIAVLIIVIAGINFVNLATARSVERAREVGVRKVLGSRKQQLISQFLSESMLISVVSIVLAAGILWTILDAFNAVSQTRLEFDVINNPIVVVVILAVSIVLGVVAGLYPAFYISALRPVQVLKGKFQSSRGGKVLRNGLVVFQFCISIILISSTLVVYDQLKFMQTKSLGFDKEDLLVINHNVVGDQSKVLMDELREIPGVETVGASNAVPGGYYYGLLFKLPGAEEIFTPKGMQADESFAAAMGLRIIDGRFFDPAFDDSLSVVVNQKAVAAMNLVDPVGTVLMNNVNATTSVPYTIIGVVEDYNYESLHSDVNPLVIMSTEGQFNQITVVAARLETDDASAMDAIEAKWKEIVPGEPFTYSFMEGRLDALYVSENQSGRLLMMFTGVAIVIACVALFGLAAYTANQRTKEIGVRKVLGASVSGIVGLLSKDFFKLVVIALLIGTPLSWFMMGAWLESFAYRVPLQVTTFLLAGVIVILFTAITVAYQAISASIVTRAVTPHCPHSA